MPVWLNIIGGLTWPMENAVGSFFKAKGRMGVDSVGRRGVFGVLVHRCRCAFAANIP
jgi:hypothetical protein